MIINKRHLPVVSKNKNLSINSVISGSIYSEDDVAESISTKLNIPFFGALFFLSILLYFIEKKYIISKEYLKRLLVFCFQIKQSVWSFKNALLV